MTLDTQTTYDELPYPGQPFIHSHPDTLATIAHLYGLEAPDVTACRVLELGCGIGGNIIPMAQTLPQSRFVGIDLSPRQIDDGRAMIAELSLGNIRLETISIVDIDEGFGQFDYILCHGVYSWVPEEVRDSILTICARNLAPNGLAYISHNTYPGWYLRRAVREILGYQAGFGGSPAEQVSLAKNFLELLSKAETDSADAFQQLIRDEVEHLSDRDDSYIFHEYLEADNTPSYFHEFVRRVTSHGLNYVGDTEIDCIDSRRLEGELHKSLAEMSQGIVDFEQRADFCRGRTFRRSLICGASRLAQRPILAARTEALFLASSARAEGEAPDIGGQDGVTFRLPNDRSLTTNSPVAKATLFNLGRRWPQRLKFVELADLVAETLGDNAPSGDELRTAIGDIALQCFPTRFVDLHTNVPEFALRAGEKPLASPFARLQAKGGRTSVTNLLHMVADLHPLHRLTLLLLDGTRDRDALLAGLVVNAQQGELNIQEEGQPIEDPKRIGQLLDTTIDSTLEFLASMALLVR